MTPPGPEFRPKKIPQTLRDNWRGLLWDDDNESPRRPHWDGDFSVSWSDPDDWHSFTQTVLAGLNSETWGVGTVIRPDTPFFVIDIDGAFDDDGNRREWCPPLELLGDGYKEWSPSGNGVHVPVFGEAPGWWKNNVKFEDRDHQEVEVLANKYCTVTGHTLPDSGTEVYAGDVSEWLEEVYERVTGESPHKDDVEPSPSETTTSEPARSSRDGPDNLDESDVEEALNHVNPDLPRQEWIKIGFAVNSWDSGSRGRRLFEQWSRSGTKWDSAAARTIRDIWDDGSRSVTLGTLVWKAKENGYTPPSHESPLPGDERVAPDGGQLEVSDYLLSSLFGVLDDESGMLKDEIYEAIDDRKNRQIDKALKYLKEAELVDKISSFDSTSRDEWFRL